MCRKSAIKLKKQQIKSFSNPKEHTMLKKTVWLAMAAAVLLSACNTVSGFGEDVQKAGNKLEQSADRHGAN